MTLVVSDLFKSTGKNFKFVERQRDLDTLVKRLDETSDEDIKKLADELSDFYAGPGIASMNYLEGFLARVTKVCAQKNIPMS